MGDTFPIIISLENFLWLTFCWLFSLAIEDVALVNIFFHSWRASQPKITFFFNNKNLQWLFPTFLVALWLSSMLIFSLSQHPMCLETYTLQNPSYLFAFVTTLLFFTSSSHFVCISSLFFPLPPYSLGFHLLPSYDPRVQLLLCFIIQQWFQWLFLASWLSLWLHHLNYGSNLYFYLTLHAWVKVLWGCNHNFGWASDSHFSWDGTFNVAILVDGLLASTSLLALPPATLPKLLCPLCTRSQLPHIFVLRSPI